MAHGQSQEQSRNQMKRLEYTISETPPIHVTLVYGLQQVIANISGPLSTVYLIHLALCTEGRPGSELFFAELLSTSIFMMGIASFIQCTFGVRLPIVQGSSTAFVPPITAMMATEEWRCPPPPQQDNTTLSTSATDIIDEPWIPRLREISGCLMAASFLQVALGCTGVMGFLMNFIGPMTICPTVALIGLSLFEAATAGMQHQWGIGLLVVALIVIFSLILGEVKVPLPIWQTGKGFVRDNFRIFKLYPHIFAILIAWLLCYILTVTDVFPTDPDKRGYMARTDAKLDAIYQAKWFFFPYPTQWGTPTFSVGLFVGFLGATLASIIESVGDYYATASASHLRPPPKHAVNRGIAIEGFASIISGLVGAAHATTSYSGTVGFIQITGVASRFVWQIMSLMLVIVGVIGKFGAALSIIPDPIIGGLTLIGLGMVIPVGLSSLQYTNMNSSRNQLILAISLMLGLMLPFWIKDNPDVINTGSATVDQFIEVILSTGMFVGGVIGFTLDNIIPGTKQERGIIEFKKSLHEEEQTDHENPKDEYDLPLITPCVQNTPCCMYVPFMPSFKDEDFHCPCASQPDTHSQSHETKHVYENGFLTDLSDENQVVSHL